MIQATGITVEFNRFGEQPRNLNLEDGATVQDALEAVGIDELSSTETVWVNGEKASGRDILEDGDSMSIVGKKEGGRK